MSVHIRTFAAAGAPAVSQTFRLRFGSVAILAGLALLSGCTWFSPDAGMGVVTTIAQQELNKDAAAIRSPEEAEAAGATVRRLLGRTLTADAAVQIALLNNRGLQAAYDELAIADAERVGQSLPPNPTFSWRRIQAGAALESEMQLVTTSSRLRRCRRAPRLPQNASIKRSCAPPKRRSASPTRRAAPTIAPSPRASSSIS